MWWVAKQCVRMAHCQHIRTGEKCAVKIFKVKHMDFDEPAVVKEVLRLKMAHEREMERVPQFIALFRSNGAAPTHPSASLAGRQARA